MKQNRITREQAIAKIKSGKIITIEFVKRSDNSIRIMNCRTGVNRYKKGKDGKGAAYSFADNGLISVYDLKEAQYKAIPQERILSIKTGGEIYQVI